MLLVIAFGGHISYVHLIFPHFKSPASKEDDAELTSCNSGLIDDNDKFYVVDEDIAVNMEMTHDWLDNEQENIEISHPIKIGVRKLRYIKLFVSVN